MVIFLYAVADGVPCEPINNAFSMVPWKERLANGSSGYSIISKIVKTEQY